MRRLAAILAALALPLVVLAPMALAAPPALIYSAHVSSLGWLPDVASPATAGTTGQSRQMEALRIAGGTFGSDLSYRAHVANIGWMAWVGPAFVAGTTGQARQLHRTRCEASDPACLHLPGRGSKGRSDNGIAGNDDSGDRCSLPGSNVHW